MQINMVAKQYPREVDMAHCPDQRRQLAPAQQKVHKPHHQQKPEGYYRPRPLSFSAGTSSTTLKGNGMRQDEHFSGPEFEKELANPPLSVILQANTKKIDKFSLSVKTNDHQDERNNMSDLSSLASQNLDPIKASNVTFPQVQVLSPFLSGHSSKGPPTDKQIMNFIEKKVAPYRSTSTHQSGKYDATPLNEETQISGDTDFNIRKPKNVTHLLTTPFSNEENVKRQGLNILTEQHTARGGQILKDNSTSSKANAALTLKPKGRRDCTTVASTEYPQIMRTVAAKCTKTEEASPVVLTAVSGMAIDMPPDMAIIGLLTCHSAQKDYKSTWLNINKNLDNADKTSAVPCKSTINQEKGETKQTAEGVTNNLVEFQTKSISVESERDTLKHIAKDADAKKGKCIEEVQHFQGTCEDAVTQSKRNTGKNAHSVNCLKCPQYEDATDQGVSQQVTSQQCFQVPQYEDISEHEEPEVKNIAIETRSLAQVPKNCDQSTSESEDYEPMELISDKLLPQKVFSSKSKAQPSSSIVFTSVPKPDFGCQDLSSSKGQKLLEWQTGKHASCSPSSVLKESEINYQIEDVHDDEWLLIPVSMVNLDFEAENPEEEQEDVGRWNATRPTNCRVHQPDSDPALCVAPSQIQVFDTVDHFLKAICEQLGICKSTSPHQLDCDAAPCNARDTNESSSEPEDSCETEDSCDYICSTEHNRLTVNRDLLKETSVLPLDTDHYLSEEESEHKVTNIEIAQTTSSTLHKQKELLAARNRSRQKVSARNDIIVLDSDTDDESDQNHERKSKQKGSLSSGSVDGGDFLCHSSRSKIGFEQVKNYTNEPNVINLDSDTDSSGSVTGHLTGGKEHIQQNTNRSRISKKYFDKVLKKDCVCKKKTVSRPVSSGSDEGNVSSFAVQKELATTMVTHHIDRETPNKTTSKISSKDSSDKLPQSVGKNAHPDNPGIAQLFVQASSQPGSYLKLSKESKGKLDPQTHTKTKSASGNDRNSTANHLPASVTKPKRTDKRVSFSNSEGPSAFVGNSTPTSGQLPQVRQRSASEGLVESVKVSALSSILKPKPSTSFSTKQLSSSKLKRSHSNTSTFQHSEASTEDLSPSTTVQSFARKRVRNEWNDSFVPTRLDRKSNLGTEKPSRTVSCDSSWPPRVGSNQSRQMAPRHRHIPNKSATPLMKKTKQEAIQRTKDINRTTSNGQGNIVAKHYKWAEEQRTAKASSWKRKRL